MLYFVLFALIITQQLHLLPAYAQVAITSLTLFWLLLTTGVATFEAYYFAFRAQPTYLSPVPVAPLTAQAVLLLLGCTLIAVFDFSQYTRLLDFGTTLFTSPTLQHVPFKH